MINLKILGGGCPNCRKLAENADAAARELGLEYQIEKISDINKITGFGAMMTPALVINGKLKTEGNVATVEEIKKLLPSA
jgi:small redox-active disulfide protein 2